MLTRNNLFEMLQQSHGDRSAKIQHVLGCLSNPEGNRNISQSLLRRRQMLYNYCNKILCRWNKCKRTRQNFLAQHSVWLNQEIVLPSEDAVLEILALVGRPTTPFKSSSDRSKRRKSVNLRSMFSAPELSYEAQMNLRSAGEQDAAQLFKEATTTPTRASKMRRTWKVEQENVGLQLLQVTKHCPSS
jgi:hypothetical protein